MDCSIAICTRNRATLLGSLLDHLERLDTEGLSCEIVVINDGSQDTTESVLERASGKGTLPLRFFSTEPTGLSNARNLALHRAQGEMVVFLDDDARPLEPSWLRHHLEAFQSPEIVATGGPMIPVWPTGAQPTWLPRQMNYMYSVTPSEFSTNIELSYPNFPFGGNLGLRRDAALEVGGFNTDLGFCGLGIISGEESDLCLRLKRAGRKIVSVSEAKVLHTIDPSKMNKEWFLQRCQGEGISKSIIESTSLPPRERYVQILRRIGITAVAFLGHSIFRSHSESPLSMLFQGQLALAKAYWSDDHSLG